VLHQAPPLGAQVEYYFGKQIFEVFEGAPGIGRIVTYKFTVADIESCGILVGALYGGVTVHTAQTPYRDRGTQHACYLGPVSAASSGSQRVGEALANLIKQRGGVRNKKREGMCQRVHIYISVGAHFHQALGVSPRRGIAAHRLYAAGHCVLKMPVVAIVEHSPESSAELAHPQTLAIAVGRVGLLHGIDVMRVGFRKYMSERGTDLITAEVRLRGSGTAASDCR